jgi:hypothetical protein
MGGLGLAEGLVAPGATRALTTGLKEFAESGVKGMGREGIQSSINTGLAPEDLMQRVARISKNKQAAFEERAGQSVGEYLVDRGIFGDPEEITQQLYSRMQESKGRVDAGLAKVQGTYKNDAVADALEQLAEREARVSTDRTPSPDRNRVSELLNRHSKDGLTLSEVNEVKRLYERTVKLDYLRDNVSDKIAQANNIDSVIREFVEKTADQAGFPNVKALNKETQLAKQLLDDLGAEYAGQAGNNYVSLSDAFFLAEAASNPTALAAFGLKKTLGSKSAMSSVAKLMARSREKRGLPTEELTERLGLPAPKEGAPDVSVEQPINLPDRSQSTVDAQERARLGNDAVMGGIAGIQVDENGQITFNPFGAALGVAGAGAIKKMSDIRVSPLTVAQRMDVEDARKLDAFVSDPADADAYMKVDPIFQAVGVPKNTDEALRTRFAEDILTEYVRLGKELP